MASTAKKLKVLQGVSGNTKTKASGYLNSELLARKGG